MGAKHRLGIALEALEGMALADTSSVDPFCHQFARRLQVTLEQHLDVWAFGILKFGT